MFRRAALAFAALLFLVPGNLLAAVCQPAPETCEAQGCGCPAPDPDESTSAWIRSCCCETQPAPAPEDFPSVPLQTPPGSPSFDAGLAVIAMTDVSVTSRQHRIGERPAYLAQAPPDPLFLRYHNLRL